MKNKKQISLKNSVFKVTILYWTIPIIIILILLSFYSNYKIKDAFLDEITITINGSLDITQHSLSYLIQESKRATYDETIETVYNQYEEDDDLIDLYRNTINYLRNAYQYNSYISETVLIYNNVISEVYSVSGFNSQWTGSDSRNFVTDNYEYIMEISDEIETYFKFVVINGDLYLIRNMVDSNFTVFAVLIFQVDTDEIFNSLNAFPFSLGSSVNIQDEIYNIIESETNLWEYENSTDINIYKVSSENYVYAEIFELDGVECECRVLIDTAVLKENYFILYLLMVFVLLMIIPLTVITAFVFYKQFSVPLRVLVHSANKIENGEIGYQIKKLPQSLEFTYLFENFNNMSRSMNEQIELIYKEQEALQNAKIKALQSQINPHFLNNTLEVINWEMRLGENQKAIEMIESLSTMLNASTARNEKPLKSLKEELMYVNAYLYIVQTRMGKRLKVVQEIEENVTSYKVPLLLLQPIVENSIEHGIANRTTGTVIIRAYEKNDKIYIEVENDNKLSEKDKRRIDKLLNWNNNEDEDNIGHTSLGIRNVNERIRLIFGEEYKLTIKSTENNATISQIILPKL